MNPELLDDSQKKECRQMLEAITCRNYSASQGMCDAPVITNPERMVLRYCWHKGAETVFDLNIIRAVHGRMQGIKTSEQMVSETSDWVKKGRQANGLD